MKELEGVAIPRVMLHARALGFTQPTTGKRVEFAAPLPCDMEAVLEALSAEG